MNLFEKRPIKLQLLVVFVMFLLVTVLVMALTFNQSKKMLYEKNREYSAELLDKVTQYIQSQLDNIDSVVKNTIYNPEIHLYLQTEDVLEKMDFFRKVDSHVALVTQVQNGINSMTVIGDNGSNFNYMSDPYKRQAVMETIDEISQMNNSQSKLYYAGFRTIVANGSEQNFFMLGAEIRNVVPVKHLGYMVAILDLDALFPQFDTMLENGFGNFYVLDRNGIVSAGNDSAMLGKRLDLTEWNSDERYVVQSADVPEIQGKVVNIYSKYDLQRGLEKVWKTYLWIFALVVPFMLFVLWVINRNLIDPIRTFMRFIQIRQVKNIYYHQMRLQMTGYYEITVMADKFNEMLDEIGNLTNEVVASKTRIMSLGLMKKQAELAYLKQQVNPHFLYNMLESFKGMASETGANDLLNHITALGRMLRYSIKGHEEVTFEQELDIAKSYIQLQLFRFDDRFEARIDVEESVLSCRVIKMILQPILENAITHGLENRIDKGHLHLEGRMKPDGDIVIRVRDDGVGMNEEKLASIRMDLAAGDEFLERDRNKEHLGIVNVHNRLRTMYGDEYGLGIKSAPGLGTEVSIHIPGRRGVPHV